MFATNLNSLAKAFLMMVTMHDFMENEHKNSLKYQVSSVAHGNKKMPIHATDRYRKNSKYWDMYV